MVANAAPIAILSIFIYITLFMSLLAFVGLIISAVVKKQGAKNFIFCLVALYSLFLAFLIFASGPSNYISVYVISIFCGLLAIAGLVVKFVLKKHIPLAYSLLAIALIAGTVGIIY